MIEDLLYLIFILLSILVSVLIIFVPIFHILISKRSHGGEKFAWFLLYCFTVWFGYIAFLIFTQKEIDKIKGRNELDEMFIKK